MVIKISKEHFHLLAPSTILSFLVTTFFIDLNNVGQTSLHVFGKNDEILQNLWSFLFLFLLYKCLQQIWSTYHQYSKIKITGLDFYFFSIFKLFSLIQVASFWSRIHTESLQVLAKAEILQNSFILSCFIWSVLWSRHIRLGW